jgi:hypothetical protein
MNRTQCLQGFLRKKTMQILRCGVNSSGMVLLSGVAPNQRGYWASRFILFGTKIIIFKVFKRVSVKFFH